MGMTESEILTSNLRPTASAGGCPPEVSAPQLQWFVMRATYCRELKVQAFLQQDNFETFVPMKQQRTDKGVKYVAAVHNIIFVRTNRDFMDAYKQQNAGLALRYMMDKSTRKPMVVRDKEMSDFIRVVSEYNPDDILYLDNPEAVLKKGTPITVVYGPYKDKKGYLLRVRRDRKVVMQLAGVVAIALSGIPIEHIKVDEE